MGHYSPSVFVSSSLSGSAVAFRLRAVRERVALTQAELAEKSGVSRTTIATAEEGKNEPYPRTVRKLAAALGVKPADLMEPER